MRVSLLLFLFLLFSCNGGEVGSISSGSTTTDDSSSSPISLTQSIISIDSSTLDEGDVTFVHVTLRDSSGNVYISPTPIQVLFYLNGGTSQGTFSSSWDNGNGSYSALFSSRTSGTPAEVRVIVNFADVRAMVYPTIEVLAPEVTWSPPGAEFGFVNLTTNSSPVTFTMTNSGNKEATGCSAPTLSNVTDFNIVSDTCGSSDLLPGNTCDVTVEATPGTLGLKRATLSRICANTGEVTTFPLRIRTTGVEPAALAWTPLTHSFPKIAVGATSSAQTFTLTNSGIGATASCSTPTLDNTVDFRITANTCGTLNLASGGTCTVDVVARPLSSGVKSATLSRICGHGGTASTTTNGISYTADFAVSLSVSPLVKDFGTVTELNAGKSEWFTFRNIANGTASGCSAPVLSNSTDFAITIDNCGTSDLGPLSECRVSVQARPQTAGTLTTTLSRTCSFGGVSTTTADGLTVTSVAAEPELIWFRSSNSLGSVSSGKSSNDFIIPLKNSGTASATGCTAPTLSNTTDFTLVSETCGVADLAPGEQCLATVRANPASAAAVSANLTRTCTVGGTPAISLDATGVTNTVTSIVSGTGLSHSCVVLSDGVVRCWGDNSLGQLGFDPAAKAASDVPVDIPTITGAVSLSTYSNHTCAVLGDATVTCWGSNTSGQLGTGDSDPEPLPVATALTDVAQVAVGASHSCALFTTGLVSCWGLNTSGQLGNGTTTNSLTPVSVSGLTGVTAIAAGANHTCALVGATVQCWGSNISGALGDGSTTNRSSPVSVSGITDAASIAAGGDFSCAVSATGDLSCWGENGEGQLGDGTQVDQNTPVAVTLGGTASSVDAGGQHACAARSDNTVMCWGKNIFNQAGDNSYTTQLSPVAVAGVTTASQIATGAAHSCALLTDNSIECWGENSSGAKLGDGNSDYKYQPNLVSTIPNVVSVAQGDRFTCAVNNTGSVFCWGDNSAGQLGDGTTTPRRTPTAIPTITTAVEVEAGGDHACALLSDDSVVCWGSDVNQALGNGAGVTNSLVPVTILTDVASVKLGYEGGCALMNNGTVRCWGMNLGDVGNNTTAATGVPTLATGITTATAIAKGVQHSCALLANKTVMCWGLNDFGQLGIGSNFVRRTPFLIPNLSDVQGIYTKAFTTCAVITDGTVKCWGLNDVGQVGDGSTSNQLSPVSVNIGDVASVSTGLSLTCAVKTGGELFCFGESTGISLTEPTRISGLPSVSAVRVFYDPCAYTASGDLYCWGVNSDNKTNADTHSRRNASGF